MTAFRGSEGEAGAEFKESEMHLEPWILSWCTIQGPVCATNADQDLSGNWEGGLAKLQKPKQAEAGVSSVHQEDRMRIGGYPWVTVFASLTPQAGQ